MAKRKTSELTHFGAMLAEILGEYTEDIDKAIAAGADEAAQIFIQKASAASPRGFTGEYRNSWTTNDSKGRYKRYVGNAKMVKGKNNTMISLRCTQNASTIG